ncbi:MAG: GNAT family N-acetyltransferase [Thermoplasmata archaeon]|nr:MAG: GNAT family N-acetyltransferase [Thermoplasmata archaeon]
MKILEYDEVGGDQVLELNVRCFGWFLSPNEVKNIRKVDKRVPEYFAFYAVERNEVLSQVGIVTVDTECTSGKEKVGFIWGVCTRPDAARSGLAMKLMKEAHDRLSGENIRYSFLVTGKSLVAYNLYNELGYKDFASSYWGLRECKSLSKSNSKITLSSKIKNNELVEIFTKYSKGLYGFVHRPENFLQVRNAWTWMPQSKVHVFKDKKSSIGYALVGKEKDILKIRELCCPNKKDISRCIRALELKLKPKYMLSEWTAGIHQINMLGQIGFKPLGSYATLMVKDLKQKHSIKKIQRLYGVKEGKFQMTPVDEY